MGRWFVLLLIIAAFSGTYWAIMSGYVADRGLAFDIGAAARQNDAKSILDELDKAEHRLDWHKRWVKRFGFIARDPDWSRVEASRDILHELQKEAADAFAVSGTDPGSEGAERVRKYLRQMPPLRTGVFRAGEAMWWKVLFWVSAAGTVLLGLLLFVRRFGD